MKDPRDKLENAAHIAEILGGFAVLVSVIYLALQISDNTRMLRSQAHYNAIELGHRPFELVLENESLAGILNQCDRNPYDVLDADWMRCKSYYFINANSWEYIYYQNLEESIPQELWVGGDNFWSNEAQTKPGWVRFWKESGIAFGEPFRTYVDDRMRDNPFFEESK